MQSDVLQALASVESPLHGSVPHVRLLTEKPSTQVVAQVDHWPHSSHLPSPGNDMSTGGSWTHMDEQ